jgi:hypothetical protein
MQKNGLILGQIPKISPKIFFFKKNWLPSRVQSEPTDNRDPSKTGVPVSVLVAKNKEPGYPSFDLGSSFGQKPKNRIELTVPLLII